MPGGHAAHEYVIPAIRGEDVPADMRSEFSTVDVQGNHGSGNIPLLQATNAAWYWHSRNNLECGKVLDAWRGYLDLDRWHTKEPYGVFRYRNWIFMSYVAVRELCALRGEAALAERFDRYIRYELLVAGLTAGWELGAGTIGGSHDVPPVPSGGARSWVAGQNDQGYVERPYVWCTDWTDLGFDYGNMTRTGCPACWETEPVLKALKQAHGIDRWKMFTAAERDLLERLRLVREPLNDHQLDDLESLLGLIAETGAKAQIPVVLFKTTEGTAWLAERSWASGSTSFKYGGFWSATGRRAVEFPESWADEIPREWGWLHAGGHSRKSDPGGEGWFDKVGGRLRLHCQTSDGTCQNGFTPGDDKHYEQWRGWVTDPGAWQPGPRTITLDGEMVWAVRIRAKGKGIDLLHPEEGVLEPPDPGPAPGPGHKPGIAKLRRSIDLLMRAEQKWDRARGPKLARRSVHKTNEALDERG